MSATTNGWTFTKERSEPGYIFRILDKHGRCLIYRKSFRPNIASDEANVRLMASSPRLLEALENLKAAVEHTPLGVRGIKAVQEATLAIAEAYGKELAA